MLTSTIADQVITALINAPAAPAKTAAARIESADFETWTHQRIFEAWLNCDLADHPAPGSVVIQINAHLLAAGHYRDTDTGLRAAVADLAGIAGHPEQLNNFINELIEQRYRREAAEYALTVAEHAANSPLAEVDGALAGIKELRRLRTRLYPGQMKLVTKKEGIA